MLFKYKKYERGFILKSSKMMEIVKVVKSQRVEFCLWKVKLWPTIYSNVIILENECEFMFGRSKLVKTVIMVKSQNVYFWFEESIRISSIWKYEDRI